MEKMSCCGDVMEKVEAESCCTPRDTAHDAARTMRNTGCGCSPVVEDKQNFKLVGVVTPREINHSVAAADRKASEVPVKDIMKPASACCHVDESLEEAGRKLHEHQATSLPLVDKAGGCCGTISGHHLPLNEIAEQTQAKLSNASMH